MSTKQTDTFESITQNIAHTVPQPIELGYDNGTDVTHFFTDKINSYTDGNLLLKDLENSGFIVIEDKGEGENVDRYKVRAVYHFYTKGFNKRVSSTILIEIILLKEGTIKLIKSVYFSSLDII